MSLSMWGQLSLVGLLLVAPATHVSAQMESLESAARAQIGVTVGYDPSYRQLRYPGGDVPVETGVCSDVIIRALRRLGVDLQQRVHEDLRANFARYPALWQLSRPDRNIDHRRVPNLETFLQRQGAALQVSADAGDYQASDIVSWRLDSGLPHIGIVADARIDGRPLIIHNIGAGVREEDRLFDWKIVGHYRYPLPAEARSP